MHTSYIGRYSLARYQPWIYTLTKFFISDNFLFRNRQTLRRLTGYVYPVYFAQGIGGLKSVILFLNGLHSPQDNEFYLLD